MRVRALPIIVAAVVAMLWAPAASAQGFKAQFTDSLDGAFDLSGWLDKAYGFVPIASIITEPALGGFGIAGGLMFVHRPVAERGMTLKRPPSISGVGGLYTANDSWGAYAFHEGHWRQDNIRYRGMIGYVSMNLKYFPPGLNGTGLEFNIAGGGTTQRLAWRIKNKRWFLGGQYLLFNNNVGFNSNGQISGVDPIEKSLRLGALGPVVNFDSRDFNFTTNNGMYVEMTVDFYDEIFGSQANFQRLKAYWLGWKRHKKVVFGLRVDGRSSAGDIPFYVLPYVQLRGIPAMRYQGKYTLVAETEERWNVSKRWALDGFAGVGKAVPDGVSFSDAETAWNVGGGFRYLLARKYNMYCGIDIARGPEQWAWYIVVGQWWNRL